MNGELEQVLRGAEMGDLLAMALESGGATLLKWQTERVYSRPGAESTGLYRVQTPAAELRVVASTLKVSDQDREALGAVRCDSRVGTLNIWAHPKDPQLPGLAIAEDAELLGHRICAATGEPTRIGSVEMLVLRPLRRAVYRVQLITATGDRVAFLKVLRPQKVADLLARHRLWPLAPPAEDLGDGLVLIEHATGVPLNALWHRDGPTGHLDQPLGSAMTPQHITDTRSTIREEAAQLPGRSAAIDRVDSFIALAETTGADRHRLDRLAQRIHRLREQPESPMVPIHGDFHPAHVFVEPTTAQVSAVIDVDSLGPGYPVDDDAVFMAHLLLLPLLDLSGYVQARDVAPEFWLFFVQTHDPGDFAARTAATLLSLSPGARSTQQFQRQLQLAEQVLTDAPLTGLGHR